MARRLCLVVVLALVAAVLSASASAPAAGTLTTTSGPVRWTGGPLTGLGTNASAQCTQLWCDEFALTIDVPVTWWGSDGRGVAIRIQWENPDGDLDFTVNDAAGAEVARSIQVAGTYEEAFLAAPLPGTYTVAITAFDGVAYAYEGSARLASPGRAALASATNTMRFSPPAIVDPQVTGGEPGVLAAPDGSVFVTSPSGTESLTSHLWRAEKGSSSFSLLDSRITSSLADPRRGPCTLALGGGDADVVVDRTGRIYFADLELTNVNVAVSTDQGATWSCNPVSAGTPLVDRPWLAVAPDADGAGPAVDAYLSYTDSGTSDEVFIRELKPYQVHFAVTDDGGRTWTETKTYAGSLISAPGRMFTMADGTVVHFFAGENAVWMARSRDEGVSFEIRKVSQRLGSPANIFIGATADQAGTLYAGWVDSGTYDLFYAVSRDHGDHWSAPLRVNPPASDTALMPWLAAGRAGELAIAWYGTPDKVRPGVAPAGTTWHAWVARSVTATASTPAFEIARLAETPIHFGPICLVGQSCAVAERSLLEFLQIDLAPDGAILASFNDNGRRQDTPPLPYILFVRQTSGLGLATSKVAAAARESEGDAASTEPLDFVGSPSAVVRGTMLQISFAVANAADLSSALSASSTVVSTAATWLVTWRTSDRLEYVAMQVDRNGAASFFGGDQPASASDVRVYPPFTYPQQFPLEGRVDAERGIVTIDVPMAALHLKAGDTLHGLQAFSMAGNPATAAFVAQQLVDATPAQSIRVGGILSTTPLPGGRKAGSPLPATGVGSSPLAPALLALAVCLALCLAATSRRRPA